MKPRNSPELHNRKNCLQRIPKTAFPLVLAFVFLTAVLAVFFVPSPFALWADLYGDAAAIDGFRGVSHGRQQHCDIFRGEWVANPESPYYTNTTCWAIHEHQNCMKYGRPDSDYQKWRWKPDGCELPIFDPRKFFELMRGRRLAFVGDSVARNHMQSLMCLLSRVEYPIDDGKDEGFKRWHYTTYNFTIQAMLSVFLVKAAEVDKHGPKGTGLFALYLDEVDEKWSSKIHEFDYVIISSGHWFTRAMRYHERGEIVGCSDCQDKSLTDLGRSYGYGRAFRTAFKAINGLKEFNGVAYLRTFAPSHFEGGLWNNGGNCLRTKPFRRGETALIDREMELYKSQLREFVAAEKEGRKRGKRFRLLDTTAAMLLRPDGHPSRYGHRPEDNVTLYNDCVHWCLPGPIDSWSDFLMEMLTREDSGEA